MLGTSAGSNTFTNTIQWIVNTTNLPNGANDHLILGLDDALTTGTGFSSLTFKLTEDGNATPIVNQTFSSVAAANTYFTNDLVDLGAWDPGSTLTLLASLSETVGSGNGYGINYMLGIDPPAPTPTPESGSLALLVGGLCGLGFVWRGRRRTSHV